MMQQSLQIINSESSEDSKPLIQNITSIFPRSSIEEHIFIRKAKSVEDFEKVFAVRWEGYKKYYHNSDENIDQFDFSHHTTLLLAEDKNSNPVGTIRILDRRYGKIELDEFIDVDSLLSMNPKSCIEPTRFSIPSHPESKLIKLLLWKAVLLYCQMNEINIVIQSVRPPAARAYRALLFEHLGPSGIYNHRQLGNLEHHTYKLDIAEKRHLLKRTNPSLYDFFYIKEQDAINIDCFRPNTAETEFLKYLYLTQHIHSTVN